MAGAGPVAVVLLLLPLRTALPERAHRQTGTGTRLFYLGMGALSLGLAVRALRSAIVVSEAGVVVRTLFGSDKYQWREIAAFQTSVGYVGLYRRSILTMTTLDGREHWFGKTFNARQATKGPSQAQVMADEMNELLADKRVSGP